MVQSYRAGLGLRNCFRHFFRIFRERPVVSAPLLALGMVAGQIPRALQCSRGSRPACVARVEWARTPAPIAVRADRRAMEGVTTDIALLDAFYSTDGPFSCHVVANFTGTTKPGIIETKETQMREQVRATAAAILLVILGGAFVSRRRVCDYRSRKRG